MGVDLVSDHSDTSFNWIEWRSCLEIAKAFGWQPLGTTAPAHYRGEWKGSYFTNDFQQVTDVDARDLGAALHRAVAALTTGQSLTNEQAEACDDMNIDTLRALAEYANKGWFLIF